MVNLSMETIYVRLGYHECVVITRDEFNELRDLVEDGESLSDKYDEEIYKVEENGIKDGWESCQEEELKPLYQAALELLVCLEAPARLKLRKETPEAAQALRLLVDDIERRLKL